MSSNIMHLKSLIAGSILLGQAFLACTAGALCLDPATFVSGYKVPLASEVRDASGIVIGRVLSVDGLREDPRDPDGYSAYKVTVRVISRLKGNLPSLIVIRNENTSARYAMSIGEEHLLFVSENGPALWVDSCGNSSAMPQGRQVVKQIRLELQRPK
jgi:hypothetical protein